jgi:hypothetical protein
MPFNKHQLVIFAARSGNVAALRERVRAGGDINYFDPKHGAPLMAAIRSGNAATIKWLLANGADVNAEYGTQIGPLEVALYRPDAEVASLLVEAGARLRKRVRPYYAVRLENCLKALGRSAKANSRAAGHVGASHRLGRAAERTIMIRTRVRRTSKLAAVLLGLFTSFGVIGCDDPSRSEVEPLVAKHATRDEVAAALGWFAYSPYGLVLNIRDNRFDPASGDAGLPPESAG